MTADWPGDTAPLPHQPREDRLGPRFAGIVGTAPKPCGPVILECTRCARPIRRGQPYMPSIPFVTSWGGFMHQYCPPKVVQA